MNTAQLAADAVAEWAADPASPVVPEAATARLVAILAGLLDDTQEAAYLEGTVRGQRQAVQAARDAWEAL